MTFVLDHTQIQLVRHISVSRKLTRMSDLDFRGLRVVASPMVATPHMKKHGWCEVVEQLSPFVPGGVCLCVFLYSLLDEGLTGLGALVWLVPVPRGSAMSMTAWWCCDRAS